jgi:hypothetical protein
MMTSSSQKGKLLKKNSITPNKDPPEERTTAIVAVMRGRSKHGHHCQHSNKHYKQKLVYKPMLLPSSKRLIPQSWNTSNGRFQTKQKAEIELNFFEYSNGKRFLAEPDIVEYDKISKPRYDLFLGVENHEKVWYHLGL